MAGENALTLDTVVVRLKELIFTEIDNDIVIMSITNSKFYGAETVGRRIWHLMKEPISIANICNVLLDEFEIDRLTCEQETLAFVEQLMKEKLIKVENAQVDSDSS